MRRDGNFAQEDSIRAYAKSDSSSPTEIYSKVGDDPPCQLSQHGSAIARYKIGSAQPIFCKASDGMDCDGIFVRPTRSLEDPKPMPTLVLVHGGPYSRITMAFNIEW